MALGVIEEARPGYYRITDLGRAALAAETSRDPEDSAYRPHVTNSRLVNSLCKNSTRSRAARRDLEALFR
jgi:hypothetical protein